MHNATSKAISELVRSMNKFVTESLSHFTESTSTSMSCVMCGADKCDIFASDIQVIYISFGCADSVLCCAVAFELYYVTVL